MKKAHEIWEPLPRVEERDFTSFVGKLIGRNFYNRESLVKNLVEANAGEW